VLMTMAISGLVGSGKTTAGKIIARRLGYQLISPSFKDIARTNGMSLSSFQKMAETDKGAIDKKFDAYIRKELKKQNSVVSTWLGPWLADGNRVLRIWLFASEFVRAKRAAKRDDVSYTTALRRLRHREKSNRQRYMKYYNIDIDNLDIFDICINSEKYRPSQIANIALSLMNTKFKLGQLTR